jgi:transposase
MIELERRVLLKHYLDQGLTKTAIAERLGISRRTIHQWIQTGQLERDLDRERVRYTRRPPVATLLDPYKPIIHQRLQAYSELTAVRLFQEIQAAGYAGSLTQLRVFVRTIRRRAEAEPVVRFETPPGKQAQLDFAGFQFPWGRRHALLVVLGYSRLLWLQFYPRQTMHTLMWGLEQASCFFGGVPHDRVFNQMKAVVIEDRRPTGGRVLENAEFLRFAAHWGFRIRACRPYRSKTKGKVERPIRYVRQSFLYGREFTGDADLNAQVLHWLTTVANVRVHGTTHEAPVVRFERDERTTLNPLAPRPYPSVLLQPERSTSTPLVRRVPHVPVERRPLVAYAELAGGAR